MTSAREQEYETAEEQYEPDDSENRGYDVGHGARVASLPTPATAAAGMPSTPEPATPKGAATSATSDRFRDATGSTKFAQGRDGWQNIVGSPSMRG